MKKSILILSLSALLLCTSCQTPVDPTPGTESLSESNSESVTESNESETESSDVIESSIGTIDFLLADFSDSLPGFQGNQEIDLVMDTINDPGRTNKKILFEEKNYDCTYRYTMVYPYSAGGVATYNGISNGDRYTFYVSDTTEEILGFICYPQDEVVTEKNLSRDDCYALALKCLRQKTPTANIYELCFEENYGYVPEHGNSYMFHFRRLIGDMPTNEKIQVSITDKGQLVTYISFYQDVFDELVNVDSSSFAYSQQALTQKINACYPGETVTYQIKDKWLVRLQDGRWSIEFDIEVDREGEFDDRLSMLALLTSLNESEDAVS